MFCVASGRHRHRYGHRPRTDLTLSRRPASEGVSDFVGQLAKQNQVTPAEFEKDFFRNARPTSLLKRFIQPEEIADVVAFLCSPLAAAIDGASVRADGGVVKSIG